MKQFYWTVCVIMMMVSAACARVGHPSSRCLAPPSHGNWVATTADGRLEGEITDLKERIPLGNVEVVLDSGLARRSDANGRFAFDGVREGRHVITTTAAAYVAHGDTLLMPVHGGLAGTLSLTLRKDILTNCEIYRS